METCLQQIWQYLLADLATDGIIFNEAHHLSQLLRFQLQLTHVNLALLQQQRDRIFLLCSVLFSISQCINVPGLQGQGKHQDR